ncbi:hypothetical protein AOE01nite_24110 [Acetobacter oeni]|uniref:Uncharacterized protein n=1 Tax=Acetobacter oeni TaxID=304077 RepID=A0A511XML3_9PROT|nr:hypothetical protein AOE01nite_24110 [Acetobacter oeni]
MQQVASGQINGIASALMQTDKNGVFLSSERKIGSAAHAGQSLNCLDRRNDRQTGFP